MGAVDMVALGKAKAVGMIVLTVRFTQEADQWVAECLELGTATYGDAFEEVQREIGELIELHLNTLEKTGQRDKFFKENGIKLYQNDSQMPTTVPTPEVAVVALGAKTAAFSMPYKVAVPA